MKVFLSGGGSEQDSKPLDDEFIEALRNSKIERIVYIPLASPSSALDSCVTWFKKVFAKKVKCIEVCKTLKDKEFTALVNNAAVYVGGGNTRTLLSAIRKDKVEKSLGNFIARGGIYYGGSAGAIILGKDARSAPETRDINLTKAKGLNLLNGYSVSCHYSETQPEDQQIFEFIDNTSSPVLALRETNGIIFNGKSLRVIGNNNIGIFNSHKKRFLFPNSSINLFASS